MEGGAETVIDVRIRFSGMSARRAFLTDAAVLSVSTAAAYGLAFFSLPVLTRIYGPGAFGVLAAFLVSANLISYFATVKAENIIGLPEADEDAIAFAQGLLCLCGVVVIAGGLLGLAAVALGLGHHVGLPGGTPLLLSIAAPLIGISAVLRALAVRVRMFRTAAVSTLARAAIAFGVALVYGISLGERGVDASLVTLAIGLILGQLAGDFTACLVIGVRQPALFKLAVGWWSTAVSVGRRYWHLVTALAASQFLAATYAPLAVMAITASQGTAGAGQYMIAERVLVAPSILIAAAVGEVFRQRAATAWAAGGDITRLMWQVRLGVAVIAAPPYLLLAFYGPSIIELLFGGEWRVAGEMSSILAISAYLSIIAGATDRAALVVGLPIYVASWHALRLITEAACAWLLLANLASISQYLWILVIARSAVYGIELTYVHFAAKRASFKRNVSRAPGEVHL